MTIFSYNDQGRARPLKRTEAPLPTARKESMPIYEYQCRKCKHLFEVLFRSCDEKMTVACPECKSIRTQRMMSAFSGKIGNTSGRDAECGSCSATSCTPS